MQNFEILFTEKNKAELVPCEMPVVAPDEVLIQMGLTTVEMVQLFHLFLNMYDVKPGKLQEIGKVSENEEEKKSFRELYQLPGVKAVRARLYASAGYSDLISIVGFDPGTFYIGESLTQRNGGNDAVDYLIEILKIHPDIIITHHPFIFGTKYRVFKYDIKKKELSEKIENALDEKDNQLICEVLSKTKNSRFISYSAARIGADNNPKSIYPNINKNVASLFVHKVFQSKCNGFYRAALEFLNQFSN